LLAWLFRFRFCLQRYEIVAKSICADCICKYTIFSKTRIFATKNLSSIMNEIDFPILQDYILSHRLFESEWHGLTHWKQVEFNGLLLATETRADTVVVRLFALFHDSKRANDGPDIVHGARGAEFAKECFEEHRLGITQEQFDKLYHACKFHTTEHHSGDATIDTCYDADRLDLGRAGIALDPKKMATALGARIAQKALEERAEPEAMREWLAEYSNRLCH
jgi:uncharacterized protein